MSSGRWSRIVFSFIINRDVMLVSCQDDRADFQTNYSDIIKRVKDFTAEIPICEESRKFTISEGDSGSLAVHVMIVEGNVFGCISPQDVPAYISFLFLSKVYDQFLQQPSLVSRSYRASEHEFDRDLKPVLTQLMEDFNEGRVDDKLMVVQNQMKDVKEILLQNVEQVIKRGELLDDLLHKTENLDSQGREFRQQARTLYVRVWWKNVRIWVAIGVVVSVIVIVAILYFAKVFKKS